MSWIQEREYGWTERLAMEVVKAGPIPRHIAFIMDGNRRFASKHLMATNEGHAKGFEKLAETLQWCRDLGVTEVTVFAFSIENFKRPKVEVDELMALAKEKFQKLLEDEEKLTKMGISVRVIGNLDLLPAEVRQQVAKAVLCTRHNKKAVLNVALAYTSRDEMVNSIREMAEGVDQGLLDIEDISEGLMERCLYSGSSSPPDLLVRTSGEHRLSDFLLWQTCYSCMHFTKILWPDFSIWHLFAAVCTYQKHVAFVQPLTARHRESYSEILKDPDRKVRITVFLEQLDDKRLKYLEAAASLL